MFLFWGPHLIKIYNDGYRPITGHKHPWALGRPGPEVWPEIWDDIKPLVDRAIAGDPTWSDEVDADPARLSQIVANLLSNAAKYTDAGGRITVAATAEEDVAVIRVRDNGTGIDADMLPRVFELFSQERQAIDRSQGGLGLGWPPAMHTGRRQLPLRSP